MGGTTNGAGRRAWTAAASGSVNGRWAAQSTAGNGEGGGSLALPRAAPAAGLSSMPAGLSPALPRVDPAAGGAVAATDDEEEEEEATGSGAASPARAG